MTVMRWFRRHNKKLMVGIGLVVMLAFGLPSAFFTGQGGRNPADEAHAYYTDAEGNRHEITGVMLQKAERDLELLQTLGMVNLTTQGVIRQLIGLEGVGEFPIMAVNLLIFPEERFSQWGRYVWGQQIISNNWANDQDQLEEMVDIVTRLTGLETTEGRLYYLLLSEEARRAGITVTDEQIISSIKRQFREYWRSLQSPLSISVVCNRFKMPEKQFDEVLSNYIAILRYGDMVTKALTMSEPQIKKIVLDQAQLENVSGTFVRFEARLLLDEITEPNTAEQQAQFDTYKQYRLGEITDENPYGFGYMLEDRVQLEYLKVDLEEAVKAVKESFAKFSARRQEEILQQYWQTNRQQFRIEIIPATEDTEAQYRDPGFDEVADQVPRLREQQEASQWAERLLAQAKGEAQKALNRSALRDLSLPERAKRAVDYRALAEQVSEESLKVTYGRSEYLDIQALMRSEEFNNAYLMRRGIAQQTLPAILFSRAPLHKGLESRLDDPPVKLYEDIDSVVVADKAVYLLRIINVDKSREAISREDDGRMGPADQESSESLMPPRQEPIYDPNQPDEQQNLLLERVKENWKAFQAIKLAQLRAEQFADQARTDWQLALTQYNEAAAGDPNDPNTISPILWEETLEKTRDQMNNYQQLSAGNPQLSELLSENIRRQRMLLIDAMKLAQERGEQAEDLAILKRESEGERLVFKDLKVVPPTIQEYLRLKPFIASALLNNSQGIMTLWHFNPENIKKRNGFEQAK